MLLITTTCKDKRASGALDTPEPGLEIPTSAQEEQIQAADVSLDLYGDPMPAGAIGRLGSIRMADRSIREMIFSADGSQVFSTHQDGTQAWNIADATRAFLLEHEDPGSHMAVASSGQYLATSSSDGRAIKVWDLKSKDIVANFKPKEKLVGLCFFGDKKLVSASDEGGLETWDLSQPNKKPLYFRGDWTDIQTIGCQENAGWIGVGSSNGQAFVTQVGSQTATQLGVAENKINHIAIAPDSSTFAFASEDENIYLWHSPAPGKAKIIQAHKRFVAKIHFSPDGARLYSSGGDSWFRIWDPKTAKRIEERRGVSDLEAQYMALSPDGSLMISWSDHAEERGPEAGRWWLWNALKGSRLLEPKRHRQAIVALAYSPDGKHIATASEDKSVRIWDSKTTQNTKVLLGAHGPVNALQFSQDGGSIYSAGADAQIQKWNWHSGKKSVAIDATGGPVNQFLILPQQHRAITGDQIGRVWSWDLKTKNKIQALDRHGYSAIYDMDHAKTRNILAIAGSSDMVRIIDLDSGKELAQLGQGNSKAVYALQFSPDESILATAGDDHKIQFWNTNDWTRQKTITGHDGTIRTLAFSSDGLRLASGGNDELVKVWSTDDAKELASFEGHQEVITGIAISPDNLTLASASRDHSVLLWEMP